MSGPGAIRAVFARCRAERRAAFIPFLVAGDPDLGATEDLLPALVRGGADIVELGVPFSDPIADGPVIQRAAVRALAAGTTLDRVLALVRRVRPGLGAPIVLFTYFNPVHSRGAVAFAREAAASGVDGVLCVDLPPEAGEDLRRSLGRGGVNSIHLLAPTSTRDRVRLAAGGGSGFVYYVSRAGVTGERQQTERGLEREVRRLRRMVKLPVAVGFGVSTAQQVAAIGRFADGVVVGSALVRFVEEDKGRGSVARRLERRVRALCGRSE